MPGGVFERGAQFLSSGYAIVPDLVTELGLSGEVAPLAARSAVVVGGRLRSFDLRRPASVLTSGLLPVRSAPRLVRELVRTRRSALPASVAPDLTEWIAYDRQPGDDWAKKSLGATAVDRLLAPAAFGLYFQQLSDNSAALAASLTRFAATRASAYSLRGGLGRLTEALAGRLPVDFDARVRDVTPTTTAVRVSTQDRTYEGCAVVLAVPGAQALQLVRDPEPLVATLLGTAYSPGLLIGLSLGRRLRRDELGGAYGVLFHPAGKPALAAVAVHSRVGPAPSSDADVLTVMFGPGTALRLRDADEPAVRAAAIQALTPFLPPLPGLVVDTQLARWEQAMPHTPIGQAARVRQYRHHLSPDSRVVLAGDYLGFPWTDSAAYNGFWAAQHLQRAICR
jgi:oxygen-dependent protoporphyrinogen oxidase